MKLIRCARCKRPLTGKEARYVGMGATCARKNPGLAAMLRAEADGQVPFSFPAAQTDQQKAGVNARLDRLPFEVVVNGRPMNDFADGSLVSINPEDPAETWSDDYPSAP